MTAQLVVSLAVILGGLFVAYTKIIRRLTRIEDVAKMASHVPNLNYRVTAIEQRLHMPTPDLPLFMNGHASEE